MQKRLERLRFVVLESPYDSWDHPLTEPLYAKMTGLKLRGYGKEYPYGVLATDTTDMISDHLLICEETEEGLQPLFGNKSVPLNKCEIHHVGFTGLTLVQEAKAEPHVRAVEQIIARARETGADLRYAGSWTVDPKERGDKEWSRLLRDLFVSLYISYHLDVPKAEIFTGATMRFKVENLVARLGHMPLQLDGRDLDPINVAHLAGERVLVTYLKEFTFEARQIAKKWESMWKNHLRIPAASPGDVALRRAA